ncbi:hypothetical protein SeMB42_g07688 [Synchytrium endobioticum]|uniref:Uncharacterized protein n=1 Tax=Synchytrium endobioticum TaxID=286115 RepID=A0A507BXR2_9FUNG|nr:hypothetical protein SeMB42_g07688 [Synchytrium endobioticum]
MSDTSNESGYPQTYAKCITVDRKANQRVVDDIREAVNDFRTIDIPAMNKIAKFDEGDYRTWVTDPIRKRAVYHFMEQIGELVNRLHYKRDMDLAEKDALYEWGQPTALYRLIRNLMAHNPHRVIKFPGMRAGAFKHLYLAITEAFARLDGIVEMLKLVKV